MVIICKYAEIICYYDFNSILTNFNGQGECTVNNIDFIDTNVSLPNNNFNKTLDKAQRDSEIKDLTEKSKYALLDLLKLRNENPVIAYLNINSHREKTVSLREICH